MAEIDEFYGELLGYAIKRTGSLHNAEDILQDVFVKLCKLDLSKINNLRAFVFTAIQHRFLDTQRKASNKYEINETDGGDYFATHFFVENQDVFRLSFEDDDEILFRRLNDCINRLNTEQKFLINEFYYRNKTYKEIVKIDNGNRTLKSIKSGIQNAKRNLRICMQNKKNG